MKKIQQYKRFMRTALNEAKKGLGRVEPNPAVGCVIAKDGKLIAKGYHQRFGGPHAEIIALKKSGKKAKGATLYVTLEPCSYFGKTPPCAEAIKKYGIREVVAGMLDPNPANSGRGFKSLRNDGIKVISGILREEARALNKDFLRRMMRRRPYVTLKLAQSLDGKIATKTGDSKWISSEKSRELVQKLRGKNDAVMIGVNTLLRDDPSLSIRKGHRQPIKIVVDGRLRTPLKAKIFKNPHSRVIIATTRKAANKKEKALIAKGADIIRIRNKSGKIVLPELMERLAAGGITSVLAEGGGELAASLLKEKLVDKLVLFIAPIIIGGRGAITSFEGDGIKKIREAFYLKDIKIEKIGKDLLIESCLQE